MSDKTVRYTLGKQERLYAQKDIDKLFAEGNSFIAYPLRIVYILKPRDLENNHPVSVMVSVSKRKFKRAVKRNRVKRLVKEAYRLNKHGFADIAVAANQDIDIAFLYLKNELPDFNEIEKAVLKTIYVLKEKLTTESGTQSDELNP